MKILNNSKVNIQNNETNENIKVKTQDNTGFLSNMSINIVNPDGLKLKNREDYMNIKNDLSSKSPF